MKRSPNITHSWFTSAEPPTKDDVACDQPVGFVVLRDNTLQYLCKSAHVVDVSHFESQEIALGIGIAYAKEHNIAMLLPAVIDFDRKVGGRTPRALDAADTCDCGEPFPCSCPR